MHIRQILAVAAASAALALAGCATSDSAPETTSVQPSPPAASTSAADAIIDRQNVMREVGGAARALGGAGTNMDAIRAQAAILTQAAQQLPSLFPAGSGPESGLETRASPAIWTNAAGFTEQTRAFSAAAQGLANATTPEAAGAATRVLGAACQSCHSQFRTQ